ncbi:U32 family peptidase [Candidatus Woesearchaeota archaeon]|nr:U32 family peptidase [Candidatus Woesearchaeota archaeon]
MPELLSPVGDFETLAAAMKAKADAVYFGIKWINMRASSARNFDIHELKEIMQKLHENKMKGYLTLNTVVYDHEISKIGTILDEAKKAKVDAIIATDFAIIQMCKERNLEVHISTQLSIANYESVKFFAQFSPRIVLARECTLDQIKDIKVKINTDKLNFSGRKIELETFVHGSLCVAFSGRCFMSQHHNRLSANRGQCLQECRRTYKITDIEDPRREFVIDGNYMMSPKDLCALPILDKLIDAGIDVFKIEGRAKGPEYIYTVTKVYREAIDLITKKKFTDKEKLSLIEQLETVYNRDFSTNFFLGTPTNNSWTRFYGSIAKETKVRIGKVTNYYPKVKVAAVLIHENQLNEGDEISFTGPTTGYYRTKATNIKINDKKVRLAKINDEVSFAVTEKVRPSDTVCIIKKRNVLEEELKLAEKIEQIGIHKPFKQSKDKKGMV